MGKYVKYGIFAVVVLTAFALFTAPASWAKPASPFPFTDTQTLDNGSEINIQLYRRGDEFLNWIETPEGYTVVKNNAGVWEYAFFPGDSKLNSTSVKYIPGQDPPAELNLEKHLKPESRPAAICAQLWETRPDM